MRPAIGLVYEPGRGLVLLTYSAGAYCQEGLPGRQWSGSRQVHDRHLAAGSLGVRPYRAYGQPGGRPRALGPGLSGPEVSLREKPPPEGGKRGDSFVTVVGRVVAAAEFVEQVCAVGCHQ
jgi:hypothetical protein